MLAGAALALSVPLAASAHIHVSPEDAPAGSATRLDFSFSHGCDGAATTTLVFTMPAGIDGVTPVLAGGWTIARALGEDGVPTQITYTAPTPVDSGIAATVSLDVIFAADASGTSVAFPVRQVCTAGETDWSEVAAPGQSEDDLAAPAPVVMVGAVAAGETGHDHDATDTATGSTEAPVDPVARWLGGGALLAAVAALGIVFFSRRRNR